ncbi:MAG: type II secretion system major pseudopilin GspG [Candidatus Poribacteria bacterium]|nr:type II secretion system major pseudopilin GspG [Candidatus Poribacteria bacterium]
MLKQLKAGESGVTLIELLIVIVILGLLAGVIALNVMPQIDNAKVATSRQDIERLKMALNLYSLQVGDYPTTEQGLEALWNPPNPVPANWNGPYVEKPKFEDSWGNEYIYQYPGNHAGYNYDLYSLGKDGKQGGDGYNADITNWIEETQ